MVLDLCVFVGQTKNRVVLDCCVCRTDKGSCGIRLTEVCVCRTEREIIGYVVSVCPTQKTFQVRYLCANYTFVWWLTLSD